MIRKQLIPQINVNDLSAEISHWYVENMGKVSKGQDLVDLGTSKANVVVQAEDSGFVKLNWKKGEMASAGEPLVFYYNTLEELKAENKNNPSSPSPKKKAPDLSEKFILNDNCGFTKFSKEAENLISERGLKSEDFANNGLVTKYHILERQKRSDANLTKHTEINLNVRNDTEAKILTSNDQIRNIEKINLAKRSEISALNIGQSGGVNSSLTVQFNAALILRTLKESGSIGLSILPLIVFEVAKLLEEYPKFNSFFDKDQIYYYKHINVGLALDFGQGPKVAVIRETNVKYPAEISELIIDYSMKYHKGGLSLAELIGSTFTVSDLSSQNIMSFQPLINGNQSAILGVGGDYSERSNVPMTLTLTFDHRVLSGLEVARFLNTLKERLLAYGITK